MATLVLDIETVGENWNEFDAPTKDALTRWVRRSSRDKTEQEALIADLKEGLGFSPFTGFIVAIGLYDLERRQGAIYYSGESDAGDIPHESFVLKQRSEKEMLEDFWEGAKSYDTFVTFNGREFDIPFILHRSVVHGVRPSRSLMDGRYLSQQKETVHIDLQDQLTFYGAMRRRPSLHLVCRAYGIPSPKAGDVSGDHVAQLFARKKFKEIAQYNARDVYATALLFEKWQMFLSPQKTEDLDF